MSPGLARTQGPENAAHHCWPGSPPDIELGLLWLLGSQPLRGRQQPRWSPWADPSPGPSIPAWRSQRPPGLPPPPHQRPLAWPRHHLSTSLLAHGAQKPGRAAWPGPPQPGGLREDPFSIAQRKLLPPLGHSTSDDAAPRPEPLAATLTAGSQRTRLWSGRRRHGAPHAFAGGRSSCPHGRPAQHVPPTWRWPVGLPAPAALQPSCITHRRLGPCGLAPDPRDGTAAHTELLMRTDVPRAHLAVAQG